MKKLRTLAIVLALVVATHVSCIGKPASVIDIDVRGADIVEVLELLASESATNIVADASLKPMRVTLHLHGITFETALHVLLQSYGLQARYSGTVLIVGNADDMGRRYGDGTDGSGSRTNVFTLVHSDPDDVAKELQAALPADTIIVADKRTGSIVMTAAPATLDRAKRLIAALDLQDTQNRSAGVSRAYALRFDKPADVVKQLKDVLPSAPLSADDAQNAVIVTGAEQTQAIAKSFIKSVDQPSAQVLFEVKVADVTPINENSNFGVEFGGIDLQGQPISNATTYSFTGGSATVNVRLNALVSQGRAQILATPKLVTLNNHEANLLIGQTYPISYFSGGAFGGQTVQFVDIGVKLKLTPTIGSDGTVTADLHPEYSEIQGFNASGLPIIANRKIDSVLRVRNDQTIVLGGLLRDVDSETITKVPALGDLPVLGGFFKNKQHAHERDEIVFLITPHVIFPNTPPPTH